MPIVYTASAPASEFLGEEGSVLVGQKRAVRALSMDMEEEQQVSQALATSGMTRSDTKSFKLSHTPGPNLVVALNPYRLPGK